LVKSPLLAISRFSLSSVSGRFIFVVKIKERTARKKSKMANPITLIRVTIRRAFASPADISTGTTRTPTVLPEKSFNRF
jgi:hypothetical protein